MMGTEIKEQHEQEYAKDKGKETIDKNKKLEWKQTVERDGQRRR